MRENLRLGRIHNRGMHYALLCQRKPNGLPYTSSDADLNWLCCRALDCARWLGYIDFEDITDERNLEPVIRLWTPQAPEAFIHRGSVAPLGPRATAARPPLTREPAEDRPLPCRIGNFMTTTQQNTRHVADDDVQNQKKQQAEQREMERMARDYMIFDCQQSLAEKIKDRPLTNRVAVDCAAALIRATTLTVFPE